MASFPSVRDVAIGTPGSASTSFSLPMPSGAVVGDRLIAFIAVNGNPSITWPSGWTQLAAYLPSANLEIACAYATYTGSNATNLTLGASSFCSSETIAVANAYGNPEVGAGNSDPVNPNAPSLSPSWGSFDVMAIAFAGYLDGTRTVTAYPYAGDNLNVRIGNVSATGMGIATTTATAASVDPGAYTISGSARAYALALAIRGHPPDVQPAALALTRSVPAPQVNQQVQGMSALALTAAAPAPTIVQSVAPAALARPAAAVAPSAVTQQVVPAALALTRSLPAPGVLAVVSPAALARTAAVVAPTQVQLRVQPAALAYPATLLAPTIPVLSTLVGRSMLLRLVGAASGTSLAQRFSVGSVGLDLAQPFDVAKGMTWVELAERFSVRGPTAGEVGQPFDVVGPQGVEVGQPFSVLGPGDGTDGGWVLSPALGYWVHD